MTERSEQRERLTIPEELLDPNSGHGLGGMQRSLGDDEGWGVSATQIGVNKGETTTLDDLEEALKSPDKPWRGHGSVKSQAGK